MMICFCGVTHTCADSPDKTLVDFICKPLTVNGFNPPGVLIMRPGRATIRAIGERGPRAFGAVVLLVVEVVTGATLAVSGVSAAVAWVTVGAAALVSDCAVSGLLAAADAALAEGLFPGESGDEFGLVVPALPIWAV
jgi:hypothetical protein